MRPASSRTSRTRRRIDDFDWPDPAQYIDPDECRRVVESAPPGRAVLGVIWSAHFQDACAAFGMENAFMQMIQAPDMFRAVIDRIADFYLKANEIFYEATPGQARRRAHRQRLRLPDRPDALAGPDPASSPCPARDSWWNRPEVTASRSSTTPAARSTTSSRT